MPASSQGFPTGSIREITSPQDEHFILTLSICGLCGVFPSNSFHPTTASSFNSSREPITSKFPHFVHSQIGRASPQYLFFFEINQSLMFVSQSSSLSRPNSGIQLIFFATSIILLRKVKADLLFEVLVEA